MKISFGKHFLLDLFIKYWGILLLVFFFSLLSVVLTVLVFLMIEPFCQLIFSGYISKLNPISSFFLSLLSPILSFENLGASISLLIVVALFIYFLKVLSTYLAQWFMAHIRSDFLYSLRNELFYKILNLPLSFFTSQRNGDIVSCAVNDTQEIEYTILNSIRQFMTEPVSVLAYLFFLFYICPLLTIYSLVLLPLTFLLIGRVARSLRQSSRISKRHLGLLLSHVEESLNGLRVIKSFNAQANSEQVFHNINDSFTDAQTHVYRRIELSSPLSEFLGVVVVMIVLVIGGSMVLSVGSSLTPALFITYIALFTQIIPPIKNFSTAFSNYRRGQAVLERVDALLNADEVILSCEHPVPIDSFDHSISVENLSFSYESVPVLSNICFTIEKGESVALVGQSGSGKSTLVDLLERFYDPTQGAVILDGIDIRQYDIAQYRSLFSLVTQDVVLFNDTLYNNITMGLSVSEADVWDAIRVANIEDFVKSLPDGLQYHLSDRGLNLSGGQRQRISIARAVLRNAPIMILDEATSAMDTESEYLVQQALDNAAKNRTLIVIAHRLSTIQNCDKILVLDNGAIVEQGTHETLLSQNGYYSKLIKIQNLN